MGFSLANKTAEMPFPSLALKKHCMHCMNIKKWFVIILLNHISENMFLKPLVLFNILNTSHNKMYLVKLCLVNDLFNGLWKRKSQL